MKTDIESTKTDKVAAISIFSDKVNHYSRTISLLLIFTIHFIATHFTASPFTITIH
jgi:hypothetical protein